MNNIIDLPKFKVYLPDGNSKSFMVYHNFAELFGCNDQYDAVKDVRKAVKLSEIEKKPKIYFGENYIGVRTPNPETMYKVIEIIDKLSKPGSKTGFSDEEWSDFHSKLLSWKTPKKQKWKIGDIFSVRLLDDTFAFGKILSNKPTVGIFEYKRESEDIVVSDLEKARILTIVHITSNSLNNWKWKVIANYRLLTNKDIGPFGSYELRVGLTSFGCSTVESVCNYYWFKKSNWSNEKDFDELIMI